MMWPLLHGVKNETNTLYQSPCIKKYAYKRRALSLLSLLLYLGASFGGRGPTTLGLGLLFPAAAVVDRRQRRRRRRFPRHRGRDRFGTDRYTGRPGGSGALRNYRRRLAARGHVLGQHHGGGRRRPGRLIGGRGAASPGRGLQYLADHFGRARGPRLLSAQCSRRHGQHRCAGPAADGVGNKNDRPRTDAPSTPRSAAGRRTTALRRSEEHAASPFALGQNCRPPDEEKTTGRSTAHAKTRRNRGVVIVWCATSSSGEGTRENWYRNDSVYRTHIHTPPRGVGEHTDAREHTRAPARQRTRLRDY